MLYDVRKSFPHPVLSDYNNDYEGVAFQASTLLREEDASLKFEAHYMLSEPELKKLIDEGKAAYVSVVKCSSTYYRQAFPTQDSTFEHTFMKGELKDRVDICPFIVSKEHIKCYRSPNFNGEYDASTFDILPGTVMAVNEPRVYYCGLPELRFGSVFDLVVGSTIKDGAFDVSLEGNKIAVLVSATQKARIDAGLQDPQTQEFVLMSVFLPALMHVLSVVRTEREAYSEMRWFRALILRLEELRKSLDDLQGDNLQLAQEMFGYPLSRLPLPETE